MAVGSSGRVIIDIEPETKKMLYKYLKLSGKTMKEWFKEKAIADFPDVFKNENNS